MKKTFLLVPTIILLSSCATINLEPGPLRTPEDSGGLSKTQELLVEGAESFLGADRLVVRGKEFRVDCSGVLMAIYYYAGIDLSPALSAYTGNGVTRTYKYMRDEKLYYNTERPQPGDIIFWDNTWDANGDGQYNDYLTHVGMVLRVDDSGLITYIHNHCILGIVAEQMNLTDPDTYKQELKNGKVVVINAPMRMNGSPPAPEGQWLASHLTRGFARGYLLAR